VAFRLTRTAIASMGTRLGLIRTRIHRRGQRVRLTPAGIEPMHARVRGMATRVCGIRAGIRSMRDPIAKTRTRIHAMRAPLRWSGGPMQTTRARISRRGACIREIHACINEMHAGNAVTHARVRSTRVRVAQMDARIPGAPTTLRGARGCLGPTRRPVGRTRPRARGVVVAVTSMSLRVLLAATGKRRTRACLHGMLHRNESPISPPRPRHYSLEVTNCIRPARRSLRNSTNGIMHLEAAFCVGTAIAAYIMLGLAAQSCGVMSSDECAQKAICRDDGGATFLDGTRELDAISGDEQVARSESGPDGVESEPAARVDATADRGESSDGLSPFAEAEGAAESDATQAEGGDGGAECGAADAIHNCGACGRACDTAHSVGAGCADAACAYTGCSAGWADCNQAAPNADGCECHTPSCCPSGVCQNAHSNGITQTWYDCVPLGTYTQAQAMAACTAFTGDSAQCTDAPVGICGPARGVCSSGASTCWCWTFAGSAAGTAEHQPGPACPVACPTGQGSRWD
jgi:hypothetical protein